MSARPAVPVRRPLLAGLLALAAVLAGGGLWAARVPIDGAVIASGQLEPPEMRQPVQHAEGGTVAELRVREGSAVAAGELLLRLDASPLQSELDKTTAQLCELRARSLRLLAERDGRALPAEAAPPPPEGAADSDRPPAAAAGRDPGRALSADIFSAPPGADCSGQIAAERLLFQARTDSLARQHARLQREGAALAARAGGLARQEAALAEQAALAEAEIARQEQLLARQLAGGDRLGQLRISAAELAARRAALAADRAEAERQAGEAGFARSQLQAARSEEAATALRDLAFTAIELRARAAELRRRIAATSLRAPVEGTVWGLQIPGPGAVLPPAAPALYVVPQGAPPLVVAQVAALARDLLHPGQPARLRLPGIDGRRSPELAAVLASVSADVFPTGSSGAPGPGVYRLELRLQPGEAARLGPDHPLQPGMPVEVFLSTGARTPLQWLFEPLTAFFRAALREN